MESITHEVLSEKLNMFYKDSQELARKEGRNLEDLDEVCCKEILKLICRWTREDENL